MGLNCWRQSSLVFPYINFNTDCLGKEPAASSPYLPHTCKDIFSIQRHRDTIFPFHHHFRALTFLRTLVSPLPSPCSLNNKEGKAFSKVTEVNHINFSSVCGWQPFTVKDQAGHSSGFAGHSPSFTAI